MRCSHSGYGEEMRIVLVPRVLMYVFMRVIDATGGDIRLGGEGSWTEVRVMKDKKCIVNNKTSRDTNELR